MFSLAFPEIAISDLRSGLRLHVKYSRFLILNNVRINPIKRAGIRSCTLISRIMILDRHLLTCLDLTPNLPLKQSLTSD